MNRIEFGDCRETMRRWAADGVRVQTCVTSPPYFGLRSYLPDDSADKPLEIGLEETPEQYIARMVDVFRCVRDVLADDGTLWLNIGDSYCSTAPGTKNAPQTKGSKTEAAQWANARPKTPEGMKPKDLIGIPWLLAFALRADGWYLRQDIIWHKPNPMPESVRDRCTKAHEYIFLLSKAERYFFDSEAMREPVSGGTHGGVKSCQGGKKQKELGQQIGGNLGNADPSGMRNRRSVWTVATRPYKGAHFATFPPALIEPCIFAGSRPGDIVLDPFMGSGTTAAVALQHGRQYLGCELNPEYGPLQQERIHAANDNLPRVADLFGGAA